MICCGAYLYKYRWKHLEARPLVVSTILITLTVLMFGLQVTYPDVLPVLSRDVEALKAGEWWRLVTPLFVQPYGPIQLLFNMMFLFVLLPMAERLYGTWVWILYFAPGVVGQLANSAWNSGGGGSSTAIFGVMGSILMYIVLYEKSAPRQFSALAILGICGAVVMCFTHDGHGPGLLTGAALAALVYWSSSRKHLNDAAHAPHEIGHS